jgi:hypothetical protein
MPLNATKLACSIVATRTAIEEGYFPVLVPAGYSKLTEEILER